MGKQAQMMAVLISIADHIVDPATSQVVSVFFVAVLIVNMRIIDVTVANIPTQKTKPSITRCLVGRCSDLMIGTGSNMTIISDAMLKAALAKKKAFVLIHLPSIFLYQLFCTGIHVKIVAMTAAK